MFANVGLCLWSLALCPLIVCAPPRNVVSAAFVVCEALWIPKWRILEIRGDREFQWCSFGLVVCIGLMYDIVHTH